MLADAWSFDTHYKYVIHTSHMISNKYILKETALTDQASQIDIPSLNQLLSTTGI